MPKRTDTVTRTLTLDDSPCGLCAILYPDETLHSCKEHMHYHISALKEDAATAYKASLSLIFAHVADTYMIMMTALSKRYGHSVEEMLEVVRQDPDWNNIYLHPTLKRMVYFEPAEEPLEEPVEEPVEESIEEPVEESIEEPVITKPVRIKRAKKIEEPVSEPVIIKRPKSKKTTSSTHSQ